jgi:hypothetical protein
VVDIIRRALEHDAAATTGEVPPVPRLTATEVPVEIVNFFLDAAMHVRVLAQIPKERCRATLHGPNDYNVRKPPDRRKRKLGPVLEESLQPGNRDAADLVVCVHSIATPQCCHA